MTKKTQYKKMFDMLVKELKIEVENNPDMPKKQVIELFMNSLEIGVYEEMFLRRTI